LTKVIFVSADGVKTIIEARDGDSVMHTAVSNGVDGIVGECGGSMMCATCHVYVDEKYLGLLPPRSEGEDEMLDCTVAEQRETSRLSCQIEVGPDIDGIIVHTPEEQQ